MSTAVQVARLRQTLGANFGEQGMRVLALPLAALEAQLAAPDPAEVNRLLDQLEDLVEGLMNKQDWREEEGS